MRSIRRMEGQFDMNMRKIGSDRAHPDGRARELTFNRCKTPQFAQEREHETGPAWSVMVGGAK